MNFYFYKPNLKEILINSIFVFIIFIIFVELVVLGNKIFHSIHVLQ